MRILFIGGTGNISSECISLLSGHEVWAITRGSGHVRRKPLPYWVKQQPDYDYMTFDVVADFVCYTKEQAEERVKTYEGRCGQYIFISSTAVYSRPAELPYTENSPTDNYYWDYAKNKREAEQVFLDSGMPVTIIRPGHTYNMTFPSCIGGNDWTVPSRILEGKPVYLCGDGTTLWTLTHAKDFAMAFYKLIGELGVYHVTSDEYMTWREIYWTITRELGCASIVKYILTRDIKNQKLYDEVMGHKTWCDIYDNSKIKSLGWEATISFRDGIRRTIKWYMEKEERRVVDENMNRLLDDMEGR